MRDNSLLINALEVSIRDILKIKKALLLLKLLENRDHLEAVIKLFVKYYGLEEELQSESLASLMGLFSITLNVQCVQSVSVPDFSFNHQSNNIVGKFKAAFPRSYGSGLSTAHRDKMTEVFIYYPLVTEFIINWIDQIVFMDKVQSVMNWIEENFQLMRLFCSRELERLIRFDSQHAAGMEKFNTDLNRCLLGGYSRQEFDKAINEHSADDDGESLLKYLDDNKKITEFLFKNLTRLDDVDKPARIRAAKFIKDIREFFMASLKRI